MSPEGIAPGPINSRQRTIGNDLWHRDRAPPATLQAERRGVQRTPATAGVLDVVTRNALALHHEFPRRMCGGHPPNLTVLGVTRCEACQRWQGSETQRGRSQGCLEGEKRKKEKVTPTETNLHGDALCFMVIGRPLLRRLAVGGWRRLVVGGWWLAGIGGWQRLAVVGVWWRLAVGGWRSLGAVFQECP